METIEKLLVSLDPLIEGTEEGRDDVNRSEMLLKKAPGEYLQKKVRDMLGYMLDSSGDSLNPGYNESEQRIAALVNNWIERAKTNPRDTFTLVAERVDGGDPVVLGLDERVAAYESRILQSRPVPGEDPSQTLPYIGLMARFKQGSGADKPLIVTEVRICYGRM